MEPGRRHPGLLGQSVRRRAPRGRLSEAGLLQNQEDLRLVSPLERGDGHGEDRGMDESLSGTWRRGRVYGEADWGVSEEEVKITGACIFAGNSRGERNRIRERKLSGFRIKICRKWSINIMG